MTVEPHTASVKLMQIQSDTQDHQGERGIAVQIRRPFLPRSCSLSLVGAGSGWVRLETRIRCSFCGLQPPGFSWHEPCVIL